MLLWSRCSTIIAPELAAREETVSDQCNKTPKRNLGVNNISPIQPVKKSGGVVGRGRTPNSHSPVILQGRNAAHWTTPSTPTLDLLVNFSLHNQAIILLASLSSPTSYKQTHPRHTEIRISDQLSFGAVALYGVVAGFWRS